MNLWAAIVNVVELFIRGGKPGHALIAFLAATLAIIVVAIGLTDKSRSFYEATFGSSRESTVVLANKNAD